MPRLPSLLLALATWFAALNIATAESDEIDLQSFKNAHRLELAAAAETLKQGFDQEIERVADTGNFAAVKALRTEKNRFTDAGALPTSDGMQSHKADYLQNRKLAAGKLHKAYTAAIAELTKQRQFERAEFLEAEMNAFVQRERVMLGLEEAAPSRPAAPRATAINNATPQILAIATRLHEELEQIAELATTTQRDEAHRALIAQLDRDISKAQAKATFIIADISDRDVNDGTYHLKLAGLQDSQTIPGLERRITGISLPLTKSEALSVRPGHLLEFTGTLHLAETDQRVKGAIEIVTVEGRANRKSYGFYIDKYKTNVRRKTPTEEAAEREAEEAEDADDGLPNATPAAGSRAANLQNASQQIQTFATRLYKELAQIAKLPTTTQRNEAHRTLVAQLDRDISKGEAKATFTIKDISEESSNDGTYRISLAELQGVKAIPGHIDRFSETVLPLSKSDALSIQPGDVLELTGTFRFSLSSKIGFLDEKYPQPVRAIEIITIYDRANRNYYGFYIDNYKANVRKQSEVEEEAKRDAKAIEEDVPEAQPNPQVPPPRRSELDFRDDAGR